MALLDDIIDRWEEARENGVELTPEELCAEHPELIDSVRWEIKALGAVDEFLELKQTGSFRLSKGSANAFTPPASLELSGKFQIIGLHASGGLGQVYLARDTVLNRTVAIKYPKRAKMPAEQLLRFEREAKITGQLEHPGIVPIYAMHLEASNEPCYVMRYIDGVTLDETVRKLIVDKRSDIATLGDDYLSSEELRGLLRSLVSLGNIVAYAHQRGFIHRDIKPSNIMLGPFGETILLDWGIAKELLAQSPDDSSAGVAEKVAEKVSDPDGRNGPSGASHHRGQGASHHRGQTPFPPKSDHDGMTLTSELTLPAVNVDSPVFTSEGQLLGTPAFASPEQVLGRHEEVNTESDIFSLGSTLYFVLSGRSPMESFGWNDYLTQIALPDTDLSRMLPSGVPPALRAICKKAMQIQPKDRYRSASDFVRDVDRYLAREPISVMREPLGSRIARWSRKRPALVGASITAFGVAFVSLVFASTLVSSKNRQLSAGNARLSKTLADLEKANADLEKSNALASETLQSVFNNATATRLATQTELTDGDNQFLKTSLQQYLEFAELQHDSEKTQAIRAEAHFQSGSIFWELSQAPEATLHLEKAISLFEELLREHEDYRYRVDLAHACSKLASLQMQGQKLKESLLTARRGLVHFETARERAGNAASRESVALKLSEADLIKTLAGTLEASGQVDEALASFEKARQLHEEILQAEPNNPHVKKALASCYRSLGDLLGSSSAKEDVLGRGADYADRAIELYRELTDDDPMERAYPYGLSWAYYDRGKVDELKGELGLAIEDVGKAITIIESLRKQYPLIDDYRVAFRIMHMRRARLAVKGERFREAADDIRCLEPGMVTSAVDVSFCVYTLQKLNKAFPKQLEYEIFLIDMLRQQAAWYEARKNYQAAEKDYKDAHIWCEFILERLGENPIAETRMALCLLELSRVHALQGDTEKAKSEYDLARAKATSIKQPSDAETELLARAFEQHDKSSQITE